MDIMQQILNNKDIHQIQNILLFNTNDDDDAQIWKFALNGVVPTRNKACSRKREEIMGSKNTSQSHASYLEDSTRFVFLPELGFVQKEFNALQQLALSATTILKTLDIFSSDLTMRSQCV
ncbi:hypothetical protein JHK85_003426 [Glycine max]|nr:hypothetical protein JHK85_003426 [Glycine max]